MESLDREASLTKWSSLDILWQRFNKEPTGDSYSGFGKVCDVQGGDTRGVEGRTSVTFRIRK